MKYTSMQNADFNWYKNNLKELYQQYGSCFLVIKNKTVIGTYESYTVAVKETVLTEDLGTFIVQECGADESAYTVSINFI